MAPGTKPLALGLDPLMISFLGVFVGSEICGLLLARHWDISEDSLSRGGPWMFVRNDLASGLALSVGLVLVGLLCLNFQLRRKFQPLSTFGIAVMFMGPAIVKLVVILIKTQHPFNIKLAKSNWVTSRAYMLDGSMLYLPYAFVLVGGLLLVLSRRIGINKGKNAYEPD